MPRVILLYNPFSDISRQKSTELEGWLRSRDVTVWRAISQECRDCPDQLVDAELIVAMGGDGTVLRAAHLAFPRNLPLLAVALGHLSFMAEVGPDEIYSAVEQVLAGDGWHDKRALIQAALWRDGQLFEEFTALNEVVISRSDISRVIEAHVSIDGSPLTTYRADGVLVATATGSTAYALSAGGPIVDPRSKALVLVPIAAHLTTVPSMVLDENAVVAIRLRLRHNASLAIDGRENLPLSEDDEVVVRRSPQVCTFVRLRPTSQFYTQLVARLHRN